VARISFDDPADPSRPSRVETFKAGDGLVTVSTNYGASLVDHAGRLWVAMNRGAAVLDPAMDVPAPPLPGLVVDHVTVQGLPRTFAPGETFLDYRERQLSFDVGLPFFHREEDTLYRTQVLGLETRPTPWGSSGRRELLALPSGSYVLRLEAMDSRGRLAAPLEFRIKVGSPPWANGWAYALYVLLAAAALGGGHLLRVRILRSRNRALEVRVARATAELHQKNLSLAHLNEEMNQFMGIAAHDLKNPMNAVLLASEEITEDPFASKEVIHSANLIRKATRQMEKLINNFLEINRMDTGRLELRLQQVDLVAVGEEVCASFQNRAAKKGIRIQTDLQAGVTGWTDPLLIREVLDNFVSNAIKFTRPGPPERTVEVRLRAAGSLAIIEVQDEGPGFTQEDQKKIFGRFVRLSARPTRGEDSSGLGLSIVKRLVEIMGAELEFETQEGQGSTFRVLLGQTKVLCQPAIRSEET
jgi:signal transduction histidine kinase